MLQDALAEIDIGAFEADDERDMQIDLACRGDDTLRDDVTAHDTAKDVDQDALDIRIAQNQLERRRHPLARRAAADIEEIRRSGAVQFDDVHRRHRQAGAIDHAADIAVELEIVKPVPAGLDLGRVLLVLIPQRRDFGVAKESVVVEPHLGVERHQLRPAGHDQRVDLRDRGVELAERPIEAGHEFDGDADLGAFEPEPEGKVARVERLDAARRVDRYPSGSSPDECAATSSISTPPSVEPISVTHPVSRSINKPR